MRVYSSTHIGSQLKLKSFLVSIITFYLFSFSLSFAGSVPHLINYQGMLTDAQGEPLETKEYILSFSIFSEPTGGTAVWGPQVFDGIPGTGHGAKVPVVRGHFNVILGPQDTHTPTYRNITDAFVSENAYLEITVGDGAPITPRQRILSTPYAVQAGIATHHSNIIPVGTIVAFWGTTAPAGWRICNGQPGTPDLRGVFLRGLDNERNFDPGRGLATYQADEFKSHNHANLGFKYLLSLRWT